MKKARNFAQTPFARVVAPPRAAARDKRVPLNVLFGLPDDFKAGISVEGDGRRLNYLLPGTADILPHLSPKRFASEIIYLQPGQKQPARLRAGPLLNHIGDADICSRALELAAQIVRKSGRPCFNHPDAIAATMRDRVAHALRGIPGLDVPKTIRVGRPMAAEVRAAVRKEGLEYPILVRVVGSHGGANMVKVDTPDEIDKVDRLERSFRSALYITEFRDFAGSDGVYRKFRIAVVGGAILVRHMITAENWLVHASHLAVHTKRTANAKQEEDEMFAAFDDGLGKRLLPMFQEIGRRLDLDYFGVDCAVAESGEVVLFEANACMAILGQTQKVLNQKAVAINRIRDAVSNLLAAPETWRRARPRAASARV
jgi:glutathione synthase/RimK-type ligase-like ATP-grasp enzyme